MIRDNVIYGNADRGVQLYPDADDSVVTGNIIDGNGRGRDLRRWSGLLLRQQPRRQQRDHGLDDPLNIESHWQGPVGSGNVARDNCVWTQRPTTTAALPRAAGSRR